MSGLRTWCRAAEALAASVSHPRADVARADDHIEQLIRASWLWSAADGIARRISAAWLESRCRRIVNAVASDRP